MSVYVVQEQGGKNILPARQFGDIITLFPEGYQVTFSKEDAVDKIRTKLMKFNDADYLLLIGDPVLIGIAASMASYYNEGRVKYLKWDRQECLYIPIQINLPKKGG